MNDEVKDDKVSEVQEDGQGEGHEAESKPEITAEPIQALEEQQNETIEE